MAAKRITPKKAATPSIRTKKPKPAARKDADVERINLESDDSLAVLRLFMKVYANL